MKGFFWTSIFCFDILIIVIHCSTDLILTDQNEEQDNDIPSNINNEINPEPFIATNEWQVVKENQAIPAGLHVRMNFQTGIKEAKLLEDEEKDVKTENELKENKSDGAKIPKIIISKESEPLDTFSNTDDKIYVTKSDLKEALNDFRDKVGTNDVHEIHWSDESKDELDKVVPHQSARKKFRSIEEIRSELEDTMGWKIKTDIQIMKEHIHVLSNETASDDQKAATLDSLEYYVHQIDNARDLERVGGFKLIVLLLNDTKELIQEKAANVIGAAAQSNRVVQDAVLNHGGMQFLLRMLRGKERLTKKKGLYALSAVIRGNSKAQQKFIKLNGLQEILKIIKEEENGSLRIKAVTLLFDLIVEQNEVIDNLIEKGKKVKGDRSPLLELLLEHDWCYIILNLLHSTEDYDGKEKIFQAITVSISACKKDYKKDSEDVVAFLKQVLGKLNYDINNEDDEDFKSYLINLKEQLEEGIIKKIES